MYAIRSYYVDGIVHYCVANMPGAYPRTSTLALTNATLPWALKLAAGKGYGDDAGLRSALNTEGGRLCNAAVANAFGMAYEPPVA